MIWTSSFSGTPLEMKLFDHHLPDWLYERLPLLYGALGLGTLLGLRGIFAIFSGTTLCVTGLVTWNLRRTYRARDRLLRQGQQRLRKGNRNAR